MKIQNIFYSFFLTVLSFQSYGQKAAVEAADKQYENYAYVDAIATYERVAEKGYKDEKMFQKLGNAYYFNADLAKAAYWYSELFAMNQEQPAEYYYRYSQALKSIGDYAKADKMLEQFNKKSGNDQRAKLFMENKNYLKDIKANSGRYTIADAGINSEYSDYGSSFFNNKLVFASARDTGGVSKKIFRWTNQTFTNLYSSEVNANGNLNSPVLFDNKINSKFHESSPVFTNDGKTMYFTRNNYLNGRKGEDDKKITLLKIYKATRAEDGKWVNITALPFNSDQYNVAHPALSPNGETLYFASDMPGTLGQSDLFKVAILKDGTYGKPENLGSAINTEGRETFPFVSDDNELYFATDGRPGLGGLDLFVAKMKKQDGFEEIQNLGAPVNSPADDFAFLIDANSRTGFFTSNRPGGKGYDDIYKFTEIKKISCEQSLSGIISDQDTGLVLANSVVSLFDEKFVLLKETKADENGYYDFQLICGKTYYVRAAQENYETKEEAVTIAKNSGRTNLSLALSKASCKVAVGDDLGKCFGIKMIYFDLDKALIRKEAAFELEKILDVMKQYPKMKIDVRSHTDSRQTAQYNLALSDRRAKATAAWLIKNGIAADRLSAKGYGESQLVNKCSDGVKCSEEDHQANRRSEFIILALE
ncbi:OmpA family protein [Flavobacterium granuli]|uniref:WD40 repeat protein n=1 Tax=Flavobacterium granuli TaxID=280093 RepID=A0A1M5UCX4_9FLAO|nr:OmpA family protein [Flavobacterium granuli]PRZ19241.1 WD40 repeat protein [Flavobacterium granuli]SHH60758.1 WD40-like Beta Propeller Repeat [Flavobacterium granuli]